MRKQWLRILLLCCALIALTAVTVFATEEDEQRGVEQRFDPWYYASYVYTNSRSRVA